MDRLQHLGTQALFPSPLTLFEIKEDDQFFKGLIEEIHEAKTQSQGLNKSNWNGWHSDYQFLNRPRPGVVKLRSLITEALLRCTAQLAPDFSWQSHEIQLEGWANVLPPGGFHTPHDHPGWVWSGCCYLSTPTGQSQFGGNIEFLDVRTGIRTLTLDGAPCFEGKYCLNPRRGMVVIFPAYLRHWVYPNDAEEPRITIAFNARYVRK